MQWRKDMSSMVPSLPPRELARDELGSLAPVSGAGYGSKDTEKNVALECIKNKMTPPGTQMLRQSTVWYLLVDLR